VDQVQEIKSKLDVVEIVREYLPNLKQAGTNWKTLCPFHNEKTPSFMVSQERQMWHCFGCGEGGDIFEFVKKIENVEFPESLRILAQKAGVVLKKQDPKLLDQRTKQLELHEAATKFFQAHLWQTTAGKHALAYLSGRGLTEDTIKTWRLGYAPESYEALTKHLKSRGYIDLEIKNSGLVVEKNKGIGYYDRFRDRIMFPLFDAQGQVVGFTGRLLKDKKGQGKYVNSPQTILYNKSYVLYGLHAAKEAIKERNKVIIVEGQMDVLSVHQAGDKNVVASSGTALTQEQLELMKRYTKTLTLAFDADQAGAKAILRATDIALKQGFKIYVLLLPAGEDPDTMVQADYPRWKILVGESTELMEYFFDLVFKGRQLDTLDARKEAARKLLQLIRKLPDAIDRDYYLKKLSSQTDISEGALREVLSEVSSVITESGGLPTTTLKSLDTKQKASQRLIAWLLVRSDLWDKAFATVLPDMIEGRSERELYSSLAVYYTDNNKVWSPDNIHIDIITQEIRLEPLALKLLHTLHILSQDLATHIDEPYAVDDFQLLCRNLQRQYWHSRLAILKAEIKQAEDAKDSAKVQALTLEVNKLIHKLSELK